MFKFTVYCPECKKDIGHLDVGGQIEEKLCQLKDLIEAVADWKAAVEAEDPMAEAMAAAHMLEVHERCVK